MPDTRPVATAPADKAQLVAYIASGEKPKPDWRIGTEHEKFVYRLADLGTPSYEEAGGIRDLLQGLTRFDCWSPVHEGDNIIALSCEDGGSVTLEPGGQLELSGAPLETIHQTCDEVGSHLNQVREVNAELGLGMVGLGFQPKWSREQTPWMPKGRYKIMRAYMPKRGGLGLDMMSRTCTVQVNLDYADEVDMVKKFRVSLALQPIATALFANSPFEDGRLNGFESYRSHIWTDTDPDRCGDLPFVFEDGFGYERYVDYMLDVPMYFVYRDGYVDASGQSFRDFLDGRLPALPGARPSLKDFTDHLTTVFPEVRLKRFLEMRGADGGPWRRLCALPALWVGLLYDQTALDAAWDLVKGWGQEQRAALRAQVPRTGLNTRVDGLGTGAHGAATVQDLALRTLEIAAHGLAARARLDSFGEDEQHFLNALREIAESGVTPAEELVRKFEGDWGGSVDPVFTEYAY